MGQNFLSCDREQELLLPPSLREWLPSEHLAWFVIDLVDEFDLSAFYAAYRADGHGRAAHEPAMMLALLVYAYAIGERSSRRIEQRCVEDVAFASSPPTRRRITRRSLGSASVTRSRSAICSARSSSSARRPGWSRLRS
jgi:hypothetical protein